MRDLILLEELIEEVKKHNKIQEEIKREMELQNDLMAFSIEKHREIPTMGLMEEMGRNRYEFLRRK